jgi:AraC family transcriptional regulator
MTKSHFSVNPNRASPIISSQNLGWESLLIEEYQQPSGGMKFEAQVNPVVVLVLTKKPHQIRETIGKNYHVGMYCQGDICITPAGIPSSYFAEDNHHYLDVQISASFLQKIAEEDMKLSQSQIEIRPIFQARNPQLEKIVSLLHMELYQYGRMGQLYLDSLANAFAINLLQDYSTTSFNVVPFQRRLYDRTLQRITHYIDESLDQNIRLADLAQLAKMSQSHFSRLFKQSTGLSPHQYLLQQRVERAKQLLKKTNKSLLEIALICGFDSHSHFTRQFKKLTGITPRSFRIN